MILKDGRYFGFWAGAGIVFLIFARMVLNRLDTIIELLRSGPV